MSAAGMSATKTERISIKTYLTYIIPSVTAFVLTGVYSIVDGLFVGQAIGDVGLAGINVAWPLVAFMMAVGTGIGMGGAVISSISAGQGDMRGEMRVIAHTITLLVIASPIVMIILLSFLEPLLYLMGGRGEVLTQAYDYLHVITIGTLFQIVGAGCIPLIRNQGHVMVALMAQVVGGLLNITLDYYLVMVLGIGVKGAAWATVTSQVFVFIVSIVFFVRLPKKLRRADFVPSWRIARRSLKIGISPFALTLLPEITTVALNIASEMHGGASAQAAYAVIAYVGVPVQWIIQGINDGAQPLVSKNFGAGALSKVKKLVRINLTLAVSVGVLGVIGFYFARSWFAWMFGISEVATGFFMTGMLLFSLAFPLYGITHALTSFFYAIERSRSALALIIGELTLTIVISIISPLLLGINGVWLTVVFVQLCLSILGIVLVVRHPLVSQR